MENVADSPTLIVLVEGEIEMLKSNCPTLSKFAVIEPGPFILAVVDELPEFVIVILPEVLQLLNL
jgi:hypothetical protein